MVVKYSLPAQLSNSSSNDSRISNRENRFLRRKDESRDNLSTPKYFTSLNTRQRSLLPKIEKDITACRFKSLGEPLAIIPGYQVPANLPELQEAYALVGHDGSNLVSPATIHTENQEKDLHYWIDLIKRPVRTRSPLSEPIICPTPKLTIDHADYQRPLGGLFKSINRKGLKKEFDVHPEFVSEKVKIGRIPGQSSNPLNYGWTK